MEVEQKDEFIEGIKRMLREKDDEFTDPDDDWLPMMFAATICADPENHDHDEWNESGPPYYDFGVILLDPELLNHKDALTEQVMPGVLEKIKEAAGGLVAAAYVASTWHVRAKDDWPKEMVELAMQVQPSQHPWRAEALMVLVVTDTDAEMHMAEIHRDDQRVPYLQEFERIGEDDDGPVKSFDGIFYQALLKGVRGEEAQEG